MRNYKLRTAEQIAEEIRRLQELHARAIERENITRYTNAARAQLRAILENHCVTLSEAEENAIFAPVANFEKSVYKAKRAAARKAAKEVPEC